MASVDEILDSVDSIEIMDAYVDLTKQSHDSYKGLCPFHDEKTPSFFVNPEKNGLYHCFGCGASGNLITFLEQIQNKEFPEVMQELAKDAGMEFSTTEISEERKYQNHLNELFSKMQTRFDFDLTHRKQVKQIYENILNKRHLTLDDIKAFDLGYVDISTLNGFMDSEDISLKDRINTGTYRVNSYGQLYPSLNKRITFELRRLNGDVVGFTGEKTNDKQQPKYKIAVKKGVTQDYFYYIGDRMPKRDSIYLCEGLYDVISLKLAGMNNPVSTLGTQTTDAQIQSLLNYTNDFVLCYDGDEPGLNAAINIYHQIKDLDQFNDVKINFVQIPDDLDPDDYRKKFGLDQFKKLVSEPIKPIDFALQLYAKQRKKTNPDKVSTIKSVLGIIMEYTQDKIEQDVYLNWLVKKSGINKDDLLKYHDDKSQKELAKQAKQHRKHEEKQPKEFQNHAKPTTEASGGIDLGALLADAAPSENSLRTDYNFGTLLYVREKSVLNYLINHSAQIKYLKNHQYKLFYHEFAMKLFQQMCDIKPDDNFKHNLINMIKSENNVIEILLEDTLQLDTSKDEFLFNVKELDANGKEDYNNELAMQKLNQTKDIDDIIKIYRNLKNRG